MASYLRVLSLNCHGYNLGMQSYLYRIRDDYDIILLQETWLSDCTCSKLDVFSDRFMVYHSSAMENKIMSGIMCGRPFGGTAVLVRQELATSCYRIATDNSRITCICLRNSRGPDLIVCSVYMPWADRSLEHVVEYEACMGCLQGVVDRHASCQFIIGGDFNVAKHSCNNCSLYVKQFVECNDMLWLDMLDGECDYTYHSDVNSHYSLLDYFIVSPSTVNGCKSVKVLNDGDNPSDHYAISCFVNVCTDTAEAAASGVHNNSSKNVKLNWNNADISAYASKVCEFLGSIHIPTDTLLCRGSCKTNHDVVLDKYYNDIKMCLHMAATCCVPSVKMGIQKHWWTPELDELKQQCIDATNLWKSVGRPRSGDINNNRVRCKLKYKNTIKEAAANADSALNDDLYEKLCNKNNTAFWKAWRKRFCSRNQKPTSTLNGCSGDENIRQEFNKYFMSTVIPNTADADDCYKQKVDDLLKCSSEQSAPLIDVNLLQDCVYEMKNNKAPGYDGICSEHVKYGGAQLLVHLCLLFNAMIAHSFVPADFCFGMIVPLLKNKHGDASRLDMYRGITLSSAVSKLFESVLVAMFGESIRSSDLQFGFKRNSSCSHAIFTFNESVRYFMKNGSRVHCVSLDAAKAFDKVLHFGLFYKMLSKGVSAVFVKILIYWYSRLQSAVLWKSVLGECFKVVSGVRQGGVLSPYLFALYIDDVIDDVKASGYGIYIGSVFIGCILYADDVVLLSGSCTGLQHMVNVCVQYGRSWDIRFNPSKSHIITFGGSYSDCSHITLDNVELRRAAKLKYLGCYFCERSGKIDISYGSSKFYGNFNNILSVVGYNRNEMATLHLVKTYCIPAVLYGCETWYLDRSDYHRLNVIWNNSFRKIFCCCWREDVSCLLFYCHTLPMSYMADQRKILFWKKAMNCDNEVIRSLAVLNRGSISMILSKYDIVTLNLSVSEMKNRMWRHFVDILYVNGRITFLD